MRIKGIFAMRAMLYGACVSPLALIAATPAMAQSVTGSVSGTVTRPDGSGVAGVTVTATNPETNASATVVTGRGGGFALDGLRPATYTVTVDVDGATIERQITVGVGADARLDLAAGDESADIVVVGAGSVIDTITSEVGTNVTRQQIARLPQTDRNFLSFAQLAPGVQYNDSETNRGFRSGASTSAGVNVFIDGVNLKNTVLDQGVAGQQDSRGNPFAQLAVQEFRVITQNYKAEYEQAGAAIVTSITRSGTNNFHGDVFGSFTDRSLSETNIFDIRANRPEPEFRRIQYGAALGGPIIRDRLFFFAAYEGNDQNRATNVIIPAGAPAALRAQFGGLEGAFVQPFRGDSFFGKLTWTPDDSNTVDMSYSQRRETDIGGFGGTTSLEAAENKVNNVSTYLMRWTHRGDDYVNEFALDHLDYNYNPTSLNPNSPTFEYQGIITLGGKDGSQDIRQQTMSIRDDFTYTGFDNHAIRGGLRYSVQDYDFRKLFFVQPKYVFTAAENYAFPRQALLGLGNPNISASNNVLGLYIQDDWDVTDRLQLNLGLRWDRESNMFNNHYVTPTNAAALLRALPQTSYFDADDYITDGTDRPVYNMIQPRFGFSYDINDDQSTVIFGGFGRYYDRNVFNNTLDEQFRLQYTIGRFEFSSDGLPRDGSPTVMWNNSYLTRDGLIALQGQALTGLPELFAVKNTARPPRTDQFSLGVRQQFGGGWSASLTASYIRGSHGYTHLFATRQNNGLGNCCDTALANSRGFANVLIGADELDTRYRAIYFTLDRPYTVSSGWGFNLAYTFAQAEQNGNDLFSLDKVVPDDFGFRDKAGVERHAFVITGMVDLPWGFRLSTLTNLGSGQAFQTFQTPDFSVNNNVIGAAYPDKNCLGLFARCEVNLTLQRDQELFSGHVVTLAVDVFNAFNNKNYTSFGGFSCCGAPPANFGFGVPNALLTLPRRIQFRAAYRF